MKKAIVIDGNSLMFRAYYGTIKQLDFFLKNNIEPTNAIKTMMLIIFRLLTENKYDYSVIAFDHKDKNFRKMEFDVYKINRKKTPDTLVSQIEPIKKIMELFGFNVFCISGIEADDVVGSSVNLLTNSDIFCEVYSSDNDLLQLVSDKCNVIQLKKGLDETICYTNQNFGNLFYGLTPSQVPDFKGINGDSSDNLPGIKGIGPKTASDLLLKFKTLESIYENVDFIESKNIKEKILADKENAFLSKKLATILTDFFKDKKADDFKCKEVNISELKKVIEKYRFSGFKKYIGD
ncbi:MAG: 5'-3' exonuclease [Malacoplasma sp.]|nr:5'-3' exonuclease [Malacoplasma sp.]MDE7075196.1 5'-3' exonuclease [Malacoplasma sp.]